MANSGAFPALLVVSLFLALVDYANGELTWDNLVVGLEAQIEDSSISGQFRYSNNTAQIEKIVSIIPDCGCVTTSAQVKAIEPGTSGAIDVKFEIGARTGLLARSVMVTLEGGSKQRLDLRLLIPDVVTIYPSRLTWSPEENSIGKAIRVSFNKGYSGKVTGILSSNPAFECSLTGNETGTYEILVVPRKTGALRTDLTITTEIGPKCIRKNFQIVASKMQ